MRHQDGMLVILVALATACSSDASSPSSSKAKGTGGSADAGDQAHPGGSMGSGGSGPNDGGAPGGGGRRASDGGSQAVGGSGPNDGGTPGMGGRRSSGGSRATGGTAGGASSGDGGAGTGGGPDAGNPPETGGAPGDGPYVRQFREAHTDLPMSPDFSLAFSKPVLAGSALVVFATESTEGEPTARPITVTDSVGGTYKLLDTLADTDDRALEAVKSFVAPNAPAGAVTVTAHYQPDTDWPSVTLVEVAGVTSAPLLANSAKFAAIANQAKNSATSGSMTFSGAPALALGFSISGRAIFGPPLPGTGFTTVATVVNWGGAEGSANLPSGTLESRLMTAAGTVAATFTPAGGSAASEERLMTLGLVLR